MLISPLQELYLQKLHLENYRNFAKFEIEASNHPMILTGENGTGKTNILEAISLLSPGRGVRGAKHEDICNMDQLQCTSRMLLQSKLGVAEIHSSYDKESNKRIIEFNGAKIPTSDLSKLVSIIWLTPQMDGIFLGNPGDRRKFLDRIVYNFLPSHADCVSKYDYHMRERAKILQHDFIDESWLKILEEKMAELGLKIAASRCIVTQKMQNAIDALDSEFPKAILSIQGLVEAEILAGKDHIHDIIKQNLYENRIKDKLSGRTNYGPHLSDFIVTHKEKNKLAKFCSTGEQKAMLIALMLAQVASHKTETGIVPILLLDEVFVHLDNRRKEYLTDFFTSEQMQTWITATDLAGIEKLGAKGEVIKLV